MKKYENFLKEIYPLKLNKVEIYKKIIENDEIYFEKFKDYFIESELLEGLRYAINLNNKNMLEFLLKLDKINVIKKDFNNNNSIINYAIKNGDLDIFKMVYFHKTFNLFKYEEDIHEKVIYEGSLEVMSFLLNDNTYNSFLYQDSTYKKLIINLIKNKEYNKLNIILNNHTFEMNKINYYNFLCELIKYTKNQKCKKYKKLLDKVIKKINKDVINKLYDHNIRYLFLIIIHSKNKTIFNKLYFNKYLYGLFKVDNEILHRIYNFNNIHAYKCIKNFDINCNNNHINLLIENKYFDFLNYLIQIEKISWLKNGVNSYLIQIINDYEKFADYLFEEKSVKSEINKDWIIKYVPVEKRNKYISKLNIINF
jgi:hypothetical protein